MNSKFSIVRKFNASIDAVFQSFTNANALAKWWGPVEAPIEMISFDCKVGGVFHYKMNGEQVSYGVFKYVEIEAPHTIAWINSFANEHGEIIKPPFEGMDIPREILNKLSLEEQDGVTTLTLISEPINASEAEIETFIAIKESMEQGYGGTFGQLENYLNQTLH